MIGPHLLLGMPCWKCRSIGFVQESIISIAERIWGVWLYIWFSSRLVAWSCVDKKSAWCVQYLLLEDKFWVVPAIAWATFSFEEFTQSLIARSPQCVSTSLHQQVFWKRPLHRSRNDAHTKCPKRPCHWNGLSNAFSRDGHTIEQHAYSMNWNMCSTCDAHIGLNTMRTRRVPYDAAIDFHHWNQQNRKHLRLELLASQGFKSFHFVALIGCFSNGQTFANQSETIATQSQVSPCSSYRKGGANSQALEDRHQAFCYQDCSCCGTQQDHCDGMYRTIIKQS